MTPNYEFPTVSEALPEILHDLLNHGDEVGSRNGRVKEFLNASITLTNPVRREVLSLNRKANVFAQIAETMWVLGGRNDVEWLSAYLPRAVDYSDNGVTWRGGYGPRLRRWTLFNGTRLDQVAHVVDLLQVDPLSRRAVISIYDPAVDTEPGKDIPCNDFLQFQSRLGALHLTVTVRSNDAMWGWSGINAFEWSTLQEIVASLLGLRVGSITFNIGSLHLYEPHWNKAESIAVENFWYHKNIVFGPAERTLEYVDKMIADWFEWEALCREGRATPDLLDEDGEPLFTAWAKAIAYFWDRDPSWLEDIQGTALGVAIARTPASVLPEPVERLASTTAAPTTGSSLSEPTRAFYEFVSDLHAKKHESYGDSWKKRGEKMSILANIARKVDRLGVGDEFDSSADTWIDLLVYLAKYRCWILGEEAGPDGVDFFLWEALRDTETFSTAGEALDITAVDVAYDLDTFMDHVDDFTPEQKEEAMRLVMLRVAPVARDIWFSEDDYRPDVNQ